MSLLSKLPFPLGYRPFGVDLFNSELFEATGVKWDVAIGGIPFFVDPTEGPIRRETADYLREQFDNAREVGEQSLTGWWLRSQWRFDGGDGIEYHEPLLGDGSEDRFRDSYGLDLFTTAGEVKLARRMDEIDITGLGTPVGMARGVGNIQIAGSTKLASLSTAGNFTLGSNSQGNLQGIDVGPSGLVWESTTTGLYENGVHTWTNSGTSGVWWLKSRLFAANGGDLYELSDAGGDLGAETPLDIPESGTTGWSWVDLAETPGAVWAGGLDNFGRGRIFVITKDEEQNTAVLERMVLPDGEKLLCMEAYLDFILVGTDRGLRIAPTAGTEAAMGPLLGDHAVYAITAWGDSIYAATQASHNGNTGVMRVDLSGGEKNGRWPWAKETYAATSSRPVAVKVLPDSERLVLLTQNALYLQSTTEPLPVGRLETGIIRWGVLEKKWFESVTIRCNATNGAIAVGTFDQDNTYDIDSVTGRSRGGDIVLALPGTPVDRVGLSFTLTPDAVGEPTFYGYQLRGFPVPKRQRLLQIPVRIQDKMQDRWGQGVGRENFGAAQQFGLEVLEEVGEPVYIQDFRTGEERRVLIEKLTHVQPHAPDSRYSNAEGVTLVTMRALDSIQRSLADSDSAG